MKKTERLVGAAVLAAALIAEAGCSDDATSTSRIACRVSDPHTHTLRTVYVDASATCPPVSTTPTVARPAGAGIAGWYFFHGNSYYGVAPKGARPATDAEANRLEDEEHQRESTAAKQDTAEEESARAARAGGSEGGERGGFGESGGHGFGG